MTSLVRSKAVWIALAGTVVATIFAPDAPDVVEAREVQPRRVGESAVERAASPEEGLVLELKPRDRKSPHSAFSLTSWAPPKSVVKREVAPPPAAPPAPRAPPLPFRVLGRYVEGGKPSVFMQFNDGTVVATVGTTIGADYRVDSVTDEAVTLTYLPLDERQVLTIDSAR
jgi:hypothetical protein